MKKNVILYRCCSLCSGGLAAKKPGDSATHTYVDPQPFQAATGGELKEQQAAWYQVTDHPVIGARVVRSTADLCGREWREMFRCRKPKKIWVKRISPIETERP